MKVPFLDKVKGVDGDGPSVVSMDTNRMNSEAGYVGRGLTLNDALKHYLKTAG